MQLIFNLPLSLEAGRHQSKASDESVTESHKTTTGAAFFHAATNVDANNGIFNAVGHDQHISITNNIDAGAKRSFHSDFCHLTRSSDPERRDIIDWLSPLNFKLIHSEIFQNREDGTGQWMLESQEFINWRDGRSKTLWCPGIREISLLFDIRSFDLNDC